MKSLKKRTLPFVLTSALLGAAALAGPGRLVPQAMAYCNYGDASHADPDCDSADSTTPQPTYTPPVFHCNLAFTRTEKCDDIENLTFTTNTQQDCLAEADNLQRGFGWHYLRAYPGGGMAYFISGSCINALDESCDASTLTEPRFGC